MSSTKSLRVGSADAMRRDARKRHDAKLSPAYYRVPRDSDGEEETKIAPERQLSQEDVESIPSLASRFVPKPGPSVEYMMCFHIQRGEGDVVAPGGAYPPFLAANYPEPSIDHSRLNFDEKCRTIAQFLFPSKMRYVTGQELSESRGTLGTLSKPYSFMFVGTDSDYSKFYSHCCVVHVVSCVCVCVRRCLASTAARVCRRRPVPLGLTCCFVLLALSCRYHPIACGWTRQHI